MNLNKVCTLQKLNLLTLHTHFLNLKNYGRGYLIQNHYQKHISLILHKQNI